MCRAAKERDPLYVKSEGSGYLDGRALDDIITVSLWDDEQSYYYDDALFLRLTLCIIRAAKIIRMIQLLRGMDRLLISSYDWERA